MNSHKTIPHTSTTRALSRAKEGPYVCTIIEAIDVALRGVHALQEDVLCCWNRGIDSAVFEEHKNDILVQNRSKIVNVLCVLVHEGRDDDDEAIRQVDLCDHVGDVVLQESYESSDRQTSYKMEAYRCQSACSRESSQPRQPCF